MKDGSLHLFLPSFMGRLFCWFIAGAQLTRSTSCLPFNFFSLWVPVDISLGEDNGTPLQYSCLENPMDGGAWKATVMGSLRVRHDWATSLSRIGEGNGNPLQCSCLENPRDGGAWWAAIYGVAQSQTRLKWLSSSCSRYFSNFTEKNVFLLVQQYLLST